MGQQTLVSGINNDGSISPAPLLSSSNKVYKLILHPDGNLVFYRFNVAIWQSTEAGGDFVDCRNDPNNHAANLRMQYDGNLAVYDKHNKHLWSSGSHLLGGTPPFKLSIEDTGGMVIHDSRGNEIWAKRPENDMAVKSPEAQKIFVPIDGDTVTIGTQDALAKTRLVGNNC